MRKMNRLIYFLLLFGCSFSLQAQNVALDSLSKKFDRYRKQSLQEKLYAHLDRTLYLTGDVMWFNVYYVDGSFHRPLDLSKVAYVEIIDLTNQSVLQTKIKLEKGEGSGSLFIPASLSSGNYTFRAYTNWMKNTSPDYYFHQSFTIVNPFIKLDKEVTSAKNQPAYSAQFFPEGGDLVNGIKSKVAFQVTNKNGAGIDFNGALVNEKNDTLVRFKPLKFGIGNFDFTPNSSESYRVIVRDVKGTNQSFPLVQAKAGGTTLRLEDIADEINIEVSRSDDEGAPIVYLFAHARQITVKAEAKFLQKDKATFKIKKDELPEGITQLTLFDDQLRPLAERLYFKKPKARLNLTIQTAQRFYDQRHKVVLNLNSSENASFSVSVHKIDSISFLKQQGITESFWLSSDLAGKIESPEFYMSDDALAVQAADNLMLTHGWRRFNWKSVLNNEISSAYIPEYRGHLITGKIIDTDGNPAKGVTTYLSSPGKIIQLYGSRSNANGEIQYEVKLTGEEKIIVQTDITKDSTYRFQINSPFSEKHSTYPIPAFNLTSSVATRLLNQSIGMQVQDIYFRDKINRFAAPFKDSISFYGKPDETYKLDDYTRFPIMEEVMREYVPGVLVRKRRDGFHFIVLDKVNNTVFKEEPLILIDGMPVFDADRIIEFDPLKVKKLEVLDRQYYLGPLTFNGLVSYSTYTNDLAGFQIDPKSLSLNYEGIQLHRQFYSPQYKDEKQVNNHLPDQRYLLYWNPAITIEKGKSIPVEFYTSDVNGTFQVTIEGMSKDGATTSSSHTITVNKQNN